MDEAIAAFYESVALSDEEADALNKKTVSMCAPSNSTIPALGLGSLVGRPRSGRPLAEVAFGVR